MSEAPWMFSPILEWVAGAMIGRSSILSTRISIALIITSATVCFLRKHQCWNDSKLHMRLISWNVNGLRACAKKGFIDTLNASGADFAALQEVRAFPAQLDAATRTPDGWYSNFAPAERPG